MYPFATERADRNARKTSAIAFLAIAVLFVANLAVLNGWVTSAAAPASPDQVPVAGVSEPSEPTVSDPLPTPTAAGTEVTIESGASVVFPVPPERAEELVVIQQLEASLVRYSATTEDGTTYSLGVIEYPVAVDVSDPAVNLLGSVTGAANNVRGRVARQRAVRVQGAPAIAFLIAAESVNLRGRNVLDDRFLYAQNVAYKGATPAEAGAFFQSLTLPKD